MRMTVEYLAYLLKERYLEQLLEAWDISDTTTRIEKVLKILPSIHVIQRNHINIDIHPVYDIQRNYINIDILPVGRTFDELHPAKRMVSFNIGNVKNSIHIFLYRDRVRLLRRSEYDCLLDKELKYSDLVPDKSYSILLSPENEIFDISLSDLTAFGLEV